MEISYTVHSCVREGFPAMAKIGDREVEVIVPGLVVELVSDIGNMGHTFRYLPENIEKAEAMFAIGAKIKGTFKAG